MLKFKTQAEFDKWTRTLPEKQRLRIVASHGERVLVDDAGAVASAPARRPVRCPAPTPGRLRRTAAWFFLAVTWAGLWGASLCLAALWGLSHCATN